MAAIQQNGMHVQTLTNQIVTMKIKLEISGSVV